MLGRTDGSIRFDNLLIQMNKQRHVSEAGRLEWSAYSGYCVYVRVTHRVLSSIDITPNELR